jgi:hypothetical protein
MEITIKVNYPNDGGDYLVVITNIADLNDLLSKVNISTNGQLIYDTEKENHNVNKN